MVRSISGSASRGRARGRAPGRKPGGAAGKVRGGARGGARHAATAALAVLVMAAATAGCKAQPVDGEPSAPPRTTAADDAKPAGRSPSPDASSPSPSSEPPATPAPKPDPQGTTLMTSGAQGKQVRELQARLRQIGHFDRSPTGYYGTLTAAAVRSFQGKRGLSTTGRTDTLTWQKLLGMTHEPTAAELNPPTTVPVAKPDKRCMTGRVLCISKNSRTLSWMIDGRVVSSMDVRFGSQYTPTREGTFSVYWKSRHHVSTIYHTAMPYAMFFSGGQAVHYSADFAARGYSGASHGCVNVRDEGKVAALFAQVRTGDKVVVYG
ncbi:MULTISPECIES: L,D-transpeptidase family protein [unclassified Streptomyces]|uniref:L,D-transpeptidase family protein n=1 Tax=unclassified Streptomyces TaxID=2593676 RepID=UPI00225561CA|nr:MULTISPECIES: L,D-transpeptidase family protein [unclassified Streptomyces]WSP57058.1 L,D-transpeptidase family protein [Streptomyces sp. NBC_01241]WSU22223.1 L,D-transpeptidase family protein [Streptomyces sp. NBC_01108]MCX4795397.1 L,D-transpeptidase family protein [Streptomyces sp. NBC_01242]WSJ36696.1 L,D-transpeptidase family protein [Streptomyces sp. NBC_01321]WSP63114.1 L,D-transpeptidase family protein [Streptomyces sp. NBC_01240]